MFRMEEEYEFEGLDQEQIELLKKLIEEQKKLELAEKKERTIEKWFQSKLPTYYVMVDKDYQQCESLRKQFPNYVSK